MIIYRCEFFDNLVDMLFLMVNSGLTATNVPSILGKRRKRHTSVKPSKITAWDRELVCLPKCYMTMFNTNGVLPIPRKKKDILASFGLVGRLHLESDWSEQEVITEVRSTFTESVNENVNFKFLQFTGTGTKSLVVPKVSASYKWGPKEVAGRADRPVYLLLQDDLENEVCLQSLGYKSILKHIFSFKNKISSTLSGNESNDSNSNDVIIDAWEPPLSPQRQPLAMAIPTRDQTSCSHSVPSSSSPPNPSGSYPHQ